MADNEERIRTLLIEDELKDSYLNYAMSVIVSRALPDVRDGLKPSQRRILVAMNDLGLGPTAKYRKCAKIAGDTSGNYHPHGEQVVYPTLVRLAQDWVMRYTLVEGQGNFGSIDGDPPAAMRYTEARMTRFSMFMLEDMEKNTVDFVSNYDETREEPRVLPGKFPNLICNGSSGIAVGMATSIPPHNLREVCDAIVALINNPAIDTAGLMQFVKGPDFPTGGIICGADTLRQIYETGRGLVAVRARLSVEEARGGKKSIIVTEIPYNQCKAKIIEHIAQLVKDDVIPGISDVRDESDRDGLRMVIEVKRGEEEQIVINQLYKHTALQDTFSIIMVALVDNMPRLLGLKEMLAEFVKHRKEVIRRRTRFLLEKAEAEAHILEGLARALEVIDEIIAIIKASKTPDEAKTTLCARFLFTEIQAEAILKMTLQRLTGLEQEKINRDLERLREEIADYHAILADDALVLDIIREDLIEIKEKYGNDRRTEISTEVIGDFKMEELIPDEEMSVTLSHQGYVKRVALAEYRTQKRGGKGLIGAEMKESDFIERLFIASTHDYILFFTSTGIVHWIKVYDLPLLQRTSKGKPISTLLSLKANDRITAAIPVKNFNEGFLVMATERGTIKKTELSAFSRPQKGGIRAVHLHDGDRLIGVNTTTGKNEIVLATSGGFAIRFSEEDIRSMGRAAAGVRGIRIRENDRVVDMIIVDPAATIMTVCEKGFGKRTSFEEYRLQSRGGKGIINVRVTEKNGRVVGTKAVSDDDDLMLISQNGIVVRIPAGDLRTIGRSTQGVRVIKLEEKDKLVSFACIRENGDVAPATAPKKESSVKVEEAEKTEASGDNVDVEPGAGEDLPDADGDDATAEKG